MHFLAGCAATTPQQPAWTPLEFPAQSAVPRVIVYGDFVDLLPEYDATPTLDLILYGPNEYGKVPLRNPQGFTQLGNLLLVCDQGRPDVIALEMTTGQCNLWTEQRRRPRCPVDICTDNQRIFVADTTSRAVLVYSADGRFERELVGPADTPATQPTEPRDEADPTLIRRYRPTALRVRDGVLFIADSGNRRIDRYDLQQASWLEPLRPPANYPRVAAPTGLDFAPDGTLHIVDSLQQRVLRVNTKGEWLPPIGRPGRGPGQFVRPKSVCCTTSGLVLVTDAGRQSVEVFRSDGTFVTEIHEVGAWKGFTLPAAIAKIAADAAPRARIIEHGWTVPDELIVVSDAMGGTPLLLMGIVTARQEAQPLAK